MTAWLTSNTGVFAGGTLFIAVGMGVAMAGADLGAPPALSHLIAVSVRFSVPWLYLAFAASSLAALFPSRTTRWLLARRRSIGLVYAAGMGWQMLFILWLALGHSDYYARVTYDTYALIEEIPGYVLLAAMVVTSFRWARRRLTPAQWRTLHLVGIYYLWGETWTTYWYEVYYYDDRQTIDVVYYWLGLLACLLRTAAWATRRSALPRPA